MMSSAGRANGDVSAGLTSEGAGSSGGAGKAPGGIGWWRARLWLSLHHDLLGVNEIRGRVAADLGHREVAVGLRHQHPQDDHDHRSDEERERSSEEHDGGGLGQRR